jgi:hypothetical protein
MNSISPQHTFNPSEELSGVKRNNEGGVIKAPERRRQKNRETLFVAPLFAINPPKGYILMPNTDWRYQLPKQLQLAMDKGNIGKFRQLLVDSCTPDVVFINQCDGLHNPFGPMTREIIGPDNMADFHIVLMQSAAGVFTKHHFYLFLKIIIIYLFPQLDYLSQTNDIRGYMDPNPFDPVTEKGGGAFLSIKCTISFSPRRSIVIHARDDTSSAGSDRDFTSILHDSTSRTLNTVSRDDSDAWPGSGIDALLKASQTHPVLNDHLLQDIKTELVVCDGDDGKPIDNTKNVTVKADEDATIDQLTASLEQFSLTAIDAVLPIMQSENLYTYEFNGQGRLFKKCTLFRWITPTTTEPVQI